MPDRTASPVRTDDPPRLDGFCRTVRPPDGRPCAVRCGCQREELRVPLDPSAGRFEPIDQEPFRPVLLQNKGERVGRAIVCAVVEKGDLAGRFALAEDLHGPHPLTPLDGPVGQAQSVQKLQRLGVYHERPGLLYRTTLRVDDPERNPLPVEYVRHGEPRGTRTDDKHLRSTHLGSFLAPLRQWPSCTYPRCVRSFPAPAAAAVRRA